MADTDLQVIQGDTEVLTVTLLDADGDPLNLTGAVLNFRVKAQHADPDADALIAKASGTGIAVVGPAANGVAAVTLDPADTRLLSPGRWVYDLQVIEAGGRVSTVLRGRLKALPDVHIGA